MGVPFFISLKDVLQKEISAMEKDLKLSAFDKKVIYVYKHIGVEKHEGWLKVGETHASRIVGEGVNRRIVEQNTAANVDYKVLYVTDAIRNNGTIFSDKDIHELLEGMDIEREETTNPETKRKSEWFKTDLQTVINAINEYKMHAVKDKDDIIVDFKLREEQAEAVERTKEYYNGILEGSNNEPAFLWNAKPRFGKTLTAYCFASEIRAKKVLIVTNRPAIADSWFTDFNKFDFSDKNQEDGKFRWLFTSSEAVRNRLNNPNGISTRGEQLMSPFLRAKNTVHFISLQDLKGRDKEDSAFKENNKWIFDWDWDLVIIDESHEGVDTSKAFRMFNNIKTNFTLYLSGTPFKALASNRFSSKQIYNWSYTDEQKAKEEWSIMDGPNPYAELPKMHIFTYQLSRILETTVEEAKGEGSEYAFDLAEFFRVTGSGEDEKFLYEDKVKLFLKNLSNPKYEYPFSDEEQRESLRHTFWLLPGVRACKNLKRLLLADEYFGSHYAQEDIIDASADGDDDRKARTALEEVRKRIGEAGSSKHPLETRTITLSCGQLTTGITVPAWTAVLMLNNCKSPSLYMQAAFRAQNPFKIATSGGECFMKQNCFVYDFAPDRILQTLAELADSGVSDTVTRTREEKVKVLINFLPVIAEDNEGKMKYLDANEVLTIPLKLITEEVVNRGFMSNRLFENISGIFGCPQDIKDILAKMDEAKGGGPVEKDPTKKPPIKPKVKIWVGNDNKIHINEDIVVATTNGLFGDKKYVEIGSGEGKEVQETINEAITQARNNGYSPETIKSIQKALTKKMPTLVVKIPDPEPQPGEEGYVEKEKPDDKPKPNEKTDMEMVRDRLRGFARTIPSFLMAYGTLDTKLENFGDNIPDDVFEELTNITKDEFKKLRDGCDFEVEDENGEKHTEHFSGFFNESVFNSSIRAFEDKQKELACYYKSDSNEDIFEYIPPQANNQIFTPKRVVRMMIEMLEKENPGIFKSTTNTFIDLYMKSGMYITEIVRRIFSETRDEYSSDTACIKHILENQVFGFVPSGILDAITKNYIFGFDSEMVISQKNFVQYDAIEAAKNEILPQIVNQFFNTEGGDMKFTAVVGNPPYQEMDGGGDGASARPIYHLFIKEAIKMCPKIISFITPSRWMKGGKGLDMFRQDMMRDERLAKIVDYEVSEKCFSGVKIDGGVNYFIWNKEHVGDLDYVYYGKDGSVDYSRRKLKTTFCDKIIRDSRQISIIEKSFNLAFDMFSNIVSAQKPYGFRADLFNNPRKYPKANLSQVGGENRNKVYGLIGGKGGKRTIGFVDSGSFTDNYGSLDKFKLFFSKAFSTDATVPPEIILAEPTELCTETFLNIGPFDTEKQASNCLKYIKTKYFRALFFFNRHSLNISQSSFELIPLQDFTENSDIDWSKSIPEIDQQLYKKYGLDEKEIAFIEEKVAPME